VSVSTEQDPALRVQVQTILRRFNTEISGVTGPDAEPLDVRALDQNGQLAGGLVAQT
jgi:hypothetical protein